MENPINTYRTMRLDQLKESLEGNKFDVYITQTAGEAKILALETIIPDLKPKSISWGGSMTHVATGLYQELKDRSEFEIIDTYAKNLSMEEVVERRRRSLLVDLFISGTNAVTQSGQLVNLDMIGNRVAAITFGPKNVLIFIGINKIVPDLEEAMFRIKEYAAPVNAMRLDKKTPCAKTSFCEECKSPDRICNTWAITEKSFPKGRTKIVLINEELGF